MYVSPYTNEHMIEMLLDSMKYMTTNLYNTREKEIIIFL